jgi:hypothetical protein
MALLVLACLQQRGANEQELTPNCSSASGLEVQQLNETFTASFKKEHSDPGHAQAQ